MDKVKVSEKYADDKAVIRLLQDTVEPIKFLKRYLTNNHLEDVTIMIGREQALYLFAKDDVERKQIFEKAMSA